MSDGNAGRDGLPNDAMNGKLANGGQQQHCNGGAAGEHGGGNAEFGCGVFPFNWGHHSAKAPQTVTVTKTLSPTVGGLSTTSRAVASASSLAKSSASSRIPATASSASAIRSSVSPQSIISLFSSATASPRSSPSTSIRSASKSAAPLSQTSTLQRSTLSTSKASSTLAIPLSASSQSPKGISTIVSSNLSTTPSASTSPKPSSSAAIANSATFVTALSITAPYPSTLSKFFPKPTAGANPLADVLPQGLGPESAAGQQASQEGGIIAGVLFGVLILASILVAFLYTRWRKKRADLEHRRSIGSLSLNGDFGGDDKVPILERFRKSMRGGKEMKMRGGGRDSGGTLTGSLRTRDSRFRRRESSSPGEAYSTNKEFGGGMGMSGALESYPYPQDWDPEKDRMITTPAPAFAPLRANRSSSLYSGSILNALSEPMTPEVPPRNPKRGMSLNFGFDTNVSSDQYGANAAVQRSASEPKRGLPERPSWRKERTEQWPRTIEDFRRSRNMGDNMRRGRPLSEGERTVYTVVAPSFRDEDEMEVKVYKESSWGGNNPFLDKRDSGKSGVGSDGKKDSEPELGILHIGIRGSDARGAWRSSNWKDSGLGKETWGGNTGYGGFEDWKDEAVVEERAVDTVSVWSEAERYEEMRRGYKGKIRFGMGVQRRLTAESRYRDMV
ncbi:uncharacterized protein PAC_06469 [Phialocephala subalpina]|uniref:Uncharacterized protein n=1 Tax=Phialocephala subalpina TaxID=576137 RepID=A0A1L7WUY8_9HELO|nr:uncharacterized protein PAC_06469 [Phialocephala subalpina]